MKYLNLLKLQKHEQKIIKSSAVHLKNMIKLSLYNKI